METQVHLIVNSKGQIRTRKDKPSLSRDEVSLLLNISVPNALFVRPTLVANVSIPKEAATPNSITCQTIVDAKEAIRMTTGLDVNIAIVEPTKEEVKKE